MSIFEMSLSLSLSRGSIVEADLIALARKQSRILTTRVSPTIYCRTYYLPSSSIGILVLQVVSSVL